MLLRIRSRLLRVLSFQIILVVMLCSVPCLSLLAETFNDRRAYVGLKLFRTLVTADLQLARKTNAQGELLIYLVYASSDTAALDYQHTLAASMPSVREQMVRVETVSLAQLLANSVPTSKPAALFIAEQLNNIELKQLIQHSITQQIILFSPFEGDVEQGVLGGVSVEASVQPLINMHTLNASQVEIKSFYLKVAKQYE